MSRRAPRPPPQTALRPVKIPQNTLQTAPRWTQEGPRPLKNLQRRPKTAPRPAPDSSRIPRETDQDRLKKPKLFGILGAETVYWGGLEGVLGLLLNMKRRVPGSWGFRWSR